MDLTIIRAEHLPDLRTFFGKKRRFYVTVTDVWTKRRTSAVQSVKQTVLWNEKIGAVNIPHPSSHLQMSLYATATIGEDILIGKQDIPYQSQTNVAFLVESRKGNLSQPVKVYVTITVRTNSITSLAAIIYVSDIEMPKQENTTAAKTRATPFEDDVELMQSTVSKPLSPQMVSTSPFINVGMAQQESLPTTRVTATKDYDDSVHSTALERLPSQSDKYSVESSFVVLSEAEVDIGIFPEKVLNYADEAMKTISISDTWKSALDNIKWVMDAVASVAELHPYAKMAWGLLSNIPQPFLRQFQRDDNVRILLEAIRDAFHFSQEADALRDIRPQSNQAQMLKLMLQHICNCGDFIQAYAKSTKFRQRFVNNIGGGVDETINNYRTTLEKLRRDFLDHATVITEMNTFRILHDLGSLSDQLEQVSGKVSDIDLDIKIPYKGGWRSDVKRELLLGTRTKFLDHVVEWVDNPDAERGLVLFGQAGTGKSSIAYEIARRFREMNRLTSYFVFLRGERSGGGDYLLFTTIIRDLSDRYPSFRTALAAVIGNNKSLASARDYHTLFHDLLLRPFQDVEIIGPILIVVDALDESGDASGEDGLHTFLAKCISKLPLQVRILITSRREKDVNLAFLAASSIRIVEMTDIVLSATTGSDIRAYLRDKLPPNVYDEYGDRLEAKAERLFQWVAVACGYIRRPPPGFTPDECVESLLDSSDDGELAMLDKLYKDILEGYFKSPKFRPRFRSVMGHLLAAFEPLSIASVTSLRQYAPPHERDDKGSVVAIVSHLGSLLSNVTSTDLSLPIIPLHTSFRDFLTDETKSGDFSVDLKKAHQDLANYCLSSMLSELKFNICELESSYLANTDVPDIDDRTKQCISKALAYACRFWDDHLERLDFNPGLFDKVQNFFDNKFLFWLEVLSVTGDVALAVSAMSALKQWLAIDQNKPSNRATSIGELMALIDDASMFVRYFGMPIAKSAPHIYISCLPFTPASSHIFKRYSTRFSRRLLFQQGQLSHWPTLEMMIPRHSGYVQSVSFSPDGQRIVSGSSDCTICVWNATTGELVGKPFSGHDDCVLSVTFSPDGQRIVSGSDDRTVCVWNATTGELVGQPFSGHNGSVLSVSFSPDGQRVISGSSDHTIRMWNVATGEMGGLFSGHAGPVSSVSFSPDGQYLVSGSYDHTVRMWDTTTREVVGRPFIGHSDYVRSVSFSPSGHCIASGSDDCTIRVWNATTGDIVTKPFRGHERYIRSVSFSPDGQRLVSGSDDHTVRIWDITAGEVVGKPYIGHHDFVRSVSFASDGQRIVSGSDDCTVRVWNTATCETVGNLPLPSGHNGYVRCVSFSPDGQRMVSGSDDNTICVWNAATGEMMGKPFKSHKTTISAVSFSPDGQHIASGSYDSTVCVWNATTGSMVGIPITGHHGPVLCVSFSHDGRRIVAGSDDRIILVNPTTGDMVGQTISGISGAVWSVSFSPDGERIVSGSDDSTVCVWNATTGELAGEPFSGHYGSVRSVSFSPDGQRIASGSEDQTVRVWNAATGDMIGQAFRGHTRAIWSVSFSPDGQRIVSGSADRTICVWNAMTGELVGKPFSGHDGAVFSVSFSPDGHRIVSSSEDHSIHVWDATAVTALERPTIRYTDDDISVSFPPHTHRTPSGSDGPMIRPHNNASEGIERSTSVSFTDHSVNTSDGWICGEGGELLFWTPPCQRSLYRPSHVCIASARPTRLDLSKFVHGRRWVECRDS